MSEARLTSLTIESPAPRRTIAVRVREGKGPGLVWLGGFKSDMKGTKAEALDRWAAEAGRACLRFDYSGHGESGGEFRDGTIGRWLEESLAVYTQFAKGPQVLIGILLAVVAVIVTTLNGLDRVPPVLRKAARIAKLSPLATATRVTLPFCAPYLLTAAKLALAYAFIGVIGSEFIMARSGVGYEISYAYTNFDNATMYPLMLLILLLSMNATAIFIRNRSSRRLRG